MPPKPKGWNSQKSAKVMPKHYKDRYVDIGGHDHFLLVMDPGDLRTWYIMFFNMGDPYEGGEFIVKMIAPDTYPFKPPSFTFLTPNGRFKTNCRPCLSTGEYHSDNWSPLTGMVGFAVQIFYGLKMPIGTMGGGIGVYDATIDEKKQFAKKSKKYNEKNYPKIMKLFEEERELYKERADIRKKHNTEQEDEDESSSSSLSSLSSLSDSSDGSDDLSSLSSLSDSEESEKPVKKPAKKKSQKKTK